MILVDTSSWVHFLRSGGDEGVRQRVSRAIEEGRACWCPMVRLELWNGAGGERERAILREFERVLVELPMTEKVWNAAFELARFARGRGVTIPASDLLIDSCAREHGAELETADSDFHLISSLRRD